MTHKARKIVIITEKVIADGVTKLVEACGATGYTISEAGGKGARGIRKSERNSVIDTFANIKIEIIVSDEKMAHDIVNKVAEKYFENYSGITFMQDVEILRPQKF